MTQCPICGLWENLSCHQPWCSRAGFAGLPEQLQSSNIPPSSRPETPSKLLEQRWNEFLSLGGLFNPGLTASVNEDALRQLALDTRDFLATLQPSASADPTGE